MEYAMSPREQFCNSTYADQMYVAERELSAFIGAVTQLFGPEEATLSAEDWLDESELVDTPPLSTSQRLASGFGCSFREIGKAANRRTGSQIRSPRWSKDSSVLHARGSRRGGQDEVALSGW